MAKKVIFILIDSFMPHVFKRAREEELVPALSFLLERGAYWDNCVTAFPTMSASVDCSLMTGEYPERHKVPGLVWYKEDENRIVNYINGGKTVWRMGILNCLKDVIIRLNETHLSKQVKTIFEELEEAGKTAASINMAVHRGKNKFTVKKPGLSRIFLWNVNLPGIYGPSICTMGTLIRSSFVRSLPWKWNQMAYWKYGVNDSFAIDAASRLVKENKLPEVTFIYMPDNDYAYHRKPEKGEKILAKVDKEIMRLLNSFGSPEEAVRQCQFIVTGDHGQTIIDAGETSVINITSCFTDMKTSRIEGVDPTSDELVICNNERMCYLYPLKNGVQERAIKQLSQEHRIDLVAWKERKGIRIRQGEGSFYFAPEGSVRDIHGRGWEIEGNLSIADISLRETEQGERLMFGQYPDLFSRLYGALYAHPGPVMMVTAEPGCEFFTVSDPVHRGGASHGSLHRTDSLVPLIITDEKNNAFFEPRIVDLKNYILKQIL